MTAPQVSLHSLIKQAKHNADFDMDFDMPLSTQGHIEFAIEWKPTGLSC